jgi:HAMP domain-containing protein
MTATTLFLSAAFLGLTSLFMARTLRSKLRPLLRRAR